MMIKLFTFQPMETQDIENTVLESTQIRVREPPVTDIPPSQPHINEMIGWQNELPSVSLF